MFGLGKIRFIPGTLGSLVTVIILYFFFNILNISSNIILIFLLLVFFYSFYAISNYIENNENKDPGEIIIDEFLGQSIPIFMYEIYHGTTKENNETLIYYLIFFILFRYFDIIKPFPVNYFDKNFKNSFGVVMDDICAGFCVVLSMIVFIIIKNYIF